VSAEVLLHLPSEIILYESLPPEDARRVLKEIAVVFKRIARSGKRDLEGELRAFSDSELCDAMRGFAGAVGLIVWGTANFNPLTELVERFSAVFYDALRGSGSRSEAKRLGGNLVWYIRGVLDVVESNPSCFRGLSSLAEALGGDFEAVRALEAGANALTAMVSEALRRL